MLYAGLDLSRQRLDVHVLDDQGQTVEVTAVRPDADALRTLASHVLRQGQEVTAAIESMTEPASSTTSSNCVAGTWPSLTRSRPRD